MPSRRTTRSPRSAAATGIVLATGLILVPLLAATPGLPAAEPLVVDWQDKFLTVTIPQLPGRDVRIQYLEAYCRSGSTDQAWDKTVIPHTTRRLDDGTGPIQLEDHLENGVVVRHTIAVEGDEVALTVVAHNPTGEFADVQWAQPCMRVDHFTGAPTEDAWEVTPAYIRQCFLYVQGKPVRLPTEPWATEARYTPGQVYCPAGVDRGDVNPRPLSSIVPSHGLCGCYSEDGKWILATAWHPYQEIFQGVITCLHNDFRIGGLKPGETKTVEGRLYVVPADLEALEQRYREDFPEAARGIGGGDRPAQPVGDR